VGRLRQHKHSLLLVVLVGMTLWSSFSHRLVLSPVVSDVLMTVIVLAVLLVIFTGQFERIAASAVAAVAVLVNWSRYVIAPQEGHLLQPVAFHALMTVFLGYTVWVILRDIFAERTISRDEVVGTVCGYLLAAAMWGNLYAIVELLAPGSFALTPELAKAATDWDGRIATFNYFSLVTLTTVGYGDITPLHAPATALAALEAVFGQFYIAIVVAQLVGLRLAQALAPPAPAATSAARPPAHPREGRTESP
jgi:hypothetical protein